MEVSNLVHRKSPVSQAAQVFFSQTQAQAPTGRGGRAVAKMLKQQAKLYRSVLGLPQQTTSLGPVCSRDGSLSVLEPETREQGSAGLPPTGGCRGRSFLPLSASATPGDPWLLPGSLQSLPYQHPAFSPVCLCLKPSSSFSSKDPSPQIWGQP